MTVQLTVIEVFPDETTKGRGTFEFLTVPAQNDQFSLPGSGNASDIMAVLYVEHQPVTIPRGQGSPDVPAVTVYAALIGE
jgi:hypothetical protein